MVTTTVQSIKISGTRVRSFFKTIRTFERATGLRKLPWRDTMDPYSIAVSELMLQQTQVDRVLPKYEAFLRAFPTVAALAKAPVSEVITLWSGLGYNRRALFLKRLAEVVMEKYAGKFPKTIIELESLPGIGSYTARAIMAFAYNTPVVLIEANIRTIYLHHFFSTSTKKISDQDLFPYIEKTLDTENPREWYNLLMDYGTFLKKNGNVAHRKSSHYIKQSTFKGSGREARGTILKLLVVGPLKKTTIFSRIKLKKAVVEQALEELKQEGFVVEKRESFSLA